MQDLLEYTQELRRQLQMLTTGNFAHRLGNIRQIILDQIAACKAGMSLVGVCPTPWRQSGGQHP